MRNRIYDELYTFLFSPTYIDSTATTKNQQQALPVKNKQIIKNSPLLPTQQLTLVHNSTFSDRFSLTNLRLKFSAKRTWKMGTERILRRSGWTLRIGTYFRYFRKGRHLWDIIAHQSVRCKNSMRWKIPSSGKIHAQSKHRHHHPTQYLCITLSTSPDKPQTSHHKLQHNIRNLHRILHTSY